MRKPDVELPGDVFPDDIPDLSDIARDAQEEVLARLHQARAVLSAAERDAVRKVQKIVLEDVPHAQPGDNADHLLAHFVGIVAERNGPNPFLARIIAAGGIGTLARNQNVRLDPQSRLGGELIEAMATEPFPRGGPLLHGVLEGTWDSEQSGGGAYRMKWLPDLGDLDEVDRWKREVMMHETAVLFASPESPDLSMTLQEWRVVMGKSHLEPGVHLEGEQLIPKWVMRLAALGRGASPSGQESPRWRFHICSESMQLVAAAYGMPTGRTYEPGSLVPRNPTAVLTCSRLALDETKGASAVRVSGIAVDAFRILSDSERLELEDTLERCGGGVPYAIARAQLPPDGLTFITAARVQRRLRKIPPERQLARVPAVLELEIGHLKKSAEIQLWEGNELVEARETNILWAHADQFNRERGMLEGKQAVTEADAEASLRIAVMGLLCTRAPGDDQATVRSESEIIRVAGAVIRRGVSAEDAKQFPALMRQEEADVRIETIHREVPPKGARPPLTLKREKL